MTISFGGKIWRDECHARKKRNIKQVVAIKMLWTRSRFDQADENFILRYLLNFT